MKAISRIRELLKKNTKILTIIIFCTVIIIIFLWITGNNTTTSENDNEPFIVETKKIILQSLEPEYFFYGNIKAKSQINILSKLSGKIVKISPKVLNNSYFEKDEVIFELDPFNYQQELLEKKAKLRELLNELDSKNLIYKEVKQQKEISERNYNRKKKLLGDIVTKKNLEDAANNLSMSTTNVLDIESKIKSLETNIDIAKTQVKVANRNLRDTKYRAPFNGKLSNSIIEVGLELSAGNLLGEFIDINNLDVEFFIGENTYTKFENLMKKKVSVIWKKSNYKNQYKAEIFYIDSIVNKERAGLNLKANLEEISINDPIKPGVFVQVMLKGNSINNAFLIDENFIYEDDFILTLEKGKVIKQKINIIGFVKDKIIVAGKTIDLNNKDVILTRINNPSLLKNVTSKK